MEIWIAVDLGRVQKAERAKRLLKSRARKIRELPGPIVAVATTCGRTHRVAIHQAERARRMLQDHRRVEPRAVLNSPFRVSHNFATETPQTQSEEESKWKSDKRAAAVMSFNLPALPSACFCVCGVSVAVHQ